MKLSIKDLFSKSDNIRKKPRILSHLMKKSLKLHLRRFENRPICLCSYKNNILETSHL